MSYESITNACVKCGKCVPGCTIHEINADESTSPRGFLELIAAVRGGELNLDKNVKKIFESCFLCTNCVDACPSSIRVDSAIEGVRSLLAKRYKIAWYKRLAFALLGNRKIMDLVAKFGFVFQSCGFKIQGRDSFESVDKRGKIHKNLGMRARFSMPMIKKGRFLLTLTQKSFLNTQPSFIDNGGSRSVGLFVGCLSNYAYTATARAVLKIAAEVKVNVDLMKRQSCCGAPQYFTGDFDSVSRLAKKNIAYFEQKLANLDAIIVPEATCSAMLNVDYEHFFELNGETEWAKRAKKVAKRIFLATKYFYDETNLLEKLESKGKSELLVTYHDPCHARKMQGVFKEPRALLGANFALVELGRSACCGFGGVSMQTEHFALASQVGAKKAEDIKASGANIVSAECSACRMQISNALENLENANFGENSQNLEKENTQILFKNPLELIASVL